MDLDALNLICAEITEDLGDGAVILCVYRPLYHITKNLGPKLMKKS